MQDLLRPIAVTATVGALGLVAAMPAFAAASPSTVYISSCGAANNTPTVTTAANGGGSAVTSIAWTSATDTLTFVNNCTSGGLTMKGFIGATSNLQWQKVAPNPGDAIVSNALGTSFTSFQFVSASNVVTLTAVGPGGGSANGGATSDVGSRDPQPVVQQFGRPSSGTCDVAAEAGLNWSGVASGGWSDSWAEWMNGGRGGSVCSRTLVYSSAAGAWKIG